MVRAGGLVAVRPYSAEEKADIYVKIAETFLADDETVRSRDHRALTIQMWRRRRRRRARPCRP